MEKIIIIGWYGTETIGDRAILAGILRILSHTADDFELKIGSLYPVLTERTLLEDYPFYRQCVNKDFPISIFNSTKIRELHRAINWCDTLIMGGGPLMDLPSMAMLDYAFATAHSIHKKTILMGCGWGPLKNPTCIKQAYSIIRHSEIVIMRDDVSTNLCSKNLLNDKSERQINGFIDPAFFATQVYMGNKQSNQREEQRISINMRDIFYGSNYASLGQKKMENILKDIVQNIAIDYPEHEILLVPMHTFYIGGDDRDVLNKIALDLHLENVSVQNNPLNLEQTLDTFYNSYFCVGTRFHSILLQTMVNGKNYILDYTDPVNGKTISMIQQLKITQFYQDRYFSLQSYLNGKNDNHIRIQDNVERYCPRWAVIDEYFSRYISEIKNGI